MEFGRLLGDNYAIKWLSWKKPLFLGIWAVGGIALESRPPASGSKGLLSRPLVNGPKCDKCRKILIDV